MPAAKVADVRVVKPLLMALWSNLRLLLKHCVGRSWFSAAIQLAGSLSTVAGSFRASLPQAVYGWLYNNAAACKHNKQSKD